MPDSFLWTPANASRQASESLSLECNGEAILVVVLGCVLVSGNVSFESLRAMLTVSDSNARDGEIAHRTAFDALRSRRTLFGRCVMASDSVQWWSSLSCSILASAWVDIETSLVKVRAIRLLGLSADEGGNVRCTVDAAIAPSLPAMTTTTTVAASTVLRTYASPPTRTAAALATAVVDTGDEMACNATDPHSFCE